MLTSKAWFLRNFENTTRCKLEAYAFTVTVVSYVKQG